MKKFPRRLWIIKEFGTFRYQVCKDEEELSIPYISLTEHEEIVKKYKIALEKIASPSPNHAFVADIDLLNSGVI